MKRMMMILVLVVLLLAMGSPAMAQETNAGPVLSSPVMVEIGNGIVVDQLVVIGVAFFLVVMLGLSGTQAVLLYRSTPPMIQGVIKMLADLVEKQVDGVVAKTPTRADDELWAMFKDNLRAMLREELEAILMKEDGAADQAEAVLKSLDEGDLNLGDPVPTGG